MARKWLEYEDGTPQRALLDAVSARYADSERFFEDVAVRAGIAPESASGTFYGLVRGTRSLPASHRSAYLDLLEIDADTLDDLEALRQPASTPKRRDRLAELEATVERLTEALETAGRAHDRLRARVLTLERAAGLRQPRARPNALATLAAPTRRGRAAR